MSNPGFSFRGFLTMSFFLIIIITTITIGNASDFTVEPLENVTVLEGEDAEFRCITDTETFYRVDWLKNDKVVYEDKGSQVEFKFEVVNVTQRDGGKYKCRVSSQK